uniref:CCHC-type domain-containing protein n=1 Tax=Strongyloides papillosus TaxID=174720 RepID=A0A0N5BIN1_STREA
MTDNKPGGGDLSLDEGATSHANFNDDDVVWAIKRDDLELFTLDYLKSIKVMEMIINKFAVDSDTEEVKEIMNEILTHISKVNEKKVDKDNDSDLIEAKRRISELEKEIEKLKISSDKESGTITTHQLIEIISLTQKNMMEAFKSLKSEQTVSGFSNIDPSNFEIFKNEEEDITHHVLGVKRRMKLRSITVDEDKFLFMMVTLSNQIAGFIEENLPYPRSYSVLRRFLLEKYDGRAAKKKLMNDINYFKLDFSKRDIGCQLKPFVQKIAIAYKELNATELLVTQRRLIMNLFSDKNTKLYFYLTTTKPDDIFEYIRQIQNIFELDNIGKTFVSRSAPRPNLAEIVCRICNKKGHIARNCLEGASNKLSSPIPSKNAKRVRDVTYEQIVSSYVNNSDDDDVTDQNVFVYMVKQTDQSNITDDIYQHIVLQINDKLSKAFIDSGSCISFVSEKLLDASEIFDVKPLIARTANNSRMSLSRMSNIYINFLNGYDIKVKAFVVGPEILVNEDILIGEDVMSRCGLSISYEGGKCVKIKDQKCVSFKTDSKESRIVKKVKICNDVVDLKNKLFSDYTSLIPKSRYDVGEGILVCDDVEVVNKNFDFKPPSYGIPYSYKERVYNDFIEMEKAGIVEQRPAKFIHPLVVIPKEGGKLRLCGDMRYINYFIKPKFLPANKPYELVHNLCGYKHYSKIDLQNAFYQVRYPETTVPLMGVKVFDKVYCFKRMVQGAKVSAVEFQRLATQIISNLGEGYFAYIDDFAIASSTTTEDHVLKVRKLLDVLHLYDMKVNVEKSSICGDQITFIGYDISEKGATISKRNIDAFIERDVPSNKRQLMSFVMAASYFRGNMPQFTRNTLFLQNMVNSLKYKTSKIIVTDEYLTAIKTLRNMMMNPMYLVKPEPHDVLYLESDASQEAVGGVIYKISSSKEKQAIMYYSKKMSICKKNRCITYLELYSIHLGVTKYREILVGHKLIILTDQKPLEGIVHTKETKFLELILPLQEYDFQIKYISGDSNGCADFFSRTNKVSLDKGSIENKEYFQDSCNSTKLAEKLFRKYHLEMGHVNLSKVKDDLVKFCYEEKLSKFKACESIKKVVEMIKQCELRTVSLVFCGHTNVKMLDDDALITSLNFIHTQLQLKTKEIRCDKGLAFGSKKFQQYLEKHGIKLNFAVSYEHYANSKVERSIRTLRGLLTKLESNIDHKGPKGFQNKLTEACYVHNTTIHSGIGVKPFNLIYAYDVGDGKMTSNLSDLKLQARLYQQFMTAPEKRVIYRKIKDGKPVNEVGVYKERIDNVTDVKLMPVDSKDKRKFVSISGYKNRIM